MSAKPEPLPPLSELYQEALQLCIDQNRPDLLTRLLDTLAELARPTLAPRR
jgi:hypothetical protein